MGFLIYTMSEACFNEIGKSKNPDRQLTVMGLMKYPPLWIHEVNPLNSNPHFS
jgi:hypothetical protein